VLERLTITNFAVARSVTVQPGAGLNVFTGETGTGKSLIVDALAFVFGARKGREVVASGTDRAVVEARLSVDGAGIVLERSIGLSGRSTLRVDGATATIETVQAMAARCVDIHGQSEQLAILRAASQLTVLDRCAGSDVLTRAFATGVRELRDVRRTTASLTADARERQRRVEQLRFEVEEIRSAALQPAEDDQLRDELSRLSSTARRIEDAEAALAALDASPLGEGLRAVNDLAARDSEATEMADMAVLLDTAGADLSRMLRRYRETIEDDPARLAQVAERLDLIARLKRKYGETINDVLVYAARAESQLADLTDTSVSAEALAEREGALVMSLARQAEDLSTKRRRAASALVDAVTAELALLGMGGAALGIGFACEDDAAGLPVCLPDYEVIDTAHAATPLDGGETFARAFSETGVDKIEFFASFNAGESPRPLGAVASGGETSRFLLALTTVFGNAADPRLVALDEVDEGVGGRGGRMVGEALRRLAERHQVICITHLPQVAALGDRHFVVSKKTDGARTWSEIEEVTGDQRVEELASMLGGVTDVNRAAARELLGEMRQA